MMCYSDIPPLFISRGLVDDLLPYLHSPGTQPLEYPVLSGLFTWVAALLTPSRVPGTFYWVNAALLMICFLGCLGRDSDDGSAPGLGWAAGGACAIRRTGQSDQLGLARRRPHLAGAARLVAVAVLLAGVVLSAWRSPRSSTPW